MKARSIVQDQVDVRTHNAYEEDIQSVVGSDSKRADVIVQISIGAGEGQREIIFEDEIGLAFCEKADFKICDKRLRRCVWRIAGGVKSPNGGVPLFGHDTNVRIAIGDERIPTFFCADYLATHPIHIRSSPNARAQKACPIVTERQIERKGVDVLAQQFLNA